MWLSDPKRYHLVFLQAHHLHRYCQWIQFDQMKLYLYMKQVQLLHISPDALELQKIEKWCSIIAQQVWFQYLQPILRSHQPIKTHESSQTANIPLKDPLFEWFSSWLFKHTLLHSYLALFSIFYALQQANYPLTGP